MMACIHKTPKGATCEQCDRNFDHVCTIATVYQVSLHVVMSLTEEEDVRDRLKPVIAQLHRNLGLPVEELAGMVSRINRLIDVDDQIRGTP